ncbi:MAG: 4-alpha-glucanotransferase [Bacteroidales bacterium]|jgi:4-alpha-glucanotransferase|nr:4-alpha-glucanotransferase [Bacteroidales bacterium]
MLIEFQIEYKTWYGQQLMIVGSLPVLGSGSVEKAVAMEYLPVNGGMWRYRLETGEEESFRYRYIVRNHQDGSVVREWGSDRVFRPVPGAKGLVLLSDHWRRMSDPAGALYSSAFTKAIFRRAEELAAGVVPQPGRKKSVLVRFRPLAARVMPGQQVAVCGSSPQLGAWEVSRAVKAGNGEFPVWDCEVAVPVADFPVSYKYVLDHSPAGTPLWEEGPDRHLSLPAGEVPQVIEVRDELFAFPGSPWKGAGVAIPVFSLRRRKGCGVGEFSDLMMLADWASSVGIRLIQILPVNDTVATHTWHDSYPYAAISVFALHPIYVNLLKIGTLRSAVTQRIIDAQGEYLDSLGRIDYEAVMALKSRFFKLIYDQQKEAFLRDPEFRDFFAANEHWLRPYAAFSYLRDLFNTPDFTRWDGFTVFTPGLLRELTDPGAPHYDDIAIHYFIQYHAHCQLLEAARYARSRGVVLKGDIPIGIYRNSVDAWMNPGLYHMDGQAGAPADDFSVTGQNWRFPTYNWEAMARDNYTWWQQRLRQMSAYFDAFRIDHILGFFRIWEIPASQVQGLMGRFNPSIPYTREEILSRGIRFDEKRFCQPYIRDYFLSELFGDLTGEVKTRFLEEYAPGCYALKPSFDTQQKIEVFLAPSPDDDADRKSTLNRLKLGLFTLVAEVLFLEAPGSHGSAWFPRNAFHATHSFRDLDPETQHLLDELYIDYFYRRNEDFWQEKAMQKLPVIKSATEMLLCGEDLGMVPACVPRVMNELGILSLEVQRMPKDPRLEFGHPARYPYLSVATPSSHDTSTIRGWWEEDRSRTRKFYNEVLGRPGEAPATCTPEMVRALVEQHLWSPAMWTVFPIQDLLGMDERLRFPEAAAERINEPGNPNHYWRYRLHLRLEDLATEMEFNRTLREMMASSGREVH